MLRNWNRSISLVTSRCPPFLLTKPRINLEKLMSLNLINNAPRHGIASSPASEDVDPIIRLSLITPHSETNLDYHHRAAVLVPLVNCPVLGLSTILTVRASHLRSHAGEVAFPGGKYEQSDSSLRDTAFREAKEEIALSISNLHFITSLPPLRSIAGIWVHPFLVRVPIVGTIEQFIDAHLSPNLDEVSDIFAVPLISFLQSDQHSSREILGRQVHMFTIHWKQKTYEVWGLTAILCVQLASLAFNKQPEFNFRYKLKLKSSQEAKL